MNPGSTKHRVSLSRFNGRGRIREYEGVLVTPIEVGSRMVVWIDETRRLMTSTIEKVHTGGGRLFIETGGSSYVLKFLGRVTGATLTAA